MNEVITLRTPLIIANEINSLKDQTKQMILCNSIEIGRRLAEAKLLVDHGQWGDWLKNYVDCSKSTANNLMRIFDEYGSNQIPLFGDNAKSQALGNLSYTQAVALLGVPEEDREEFVKEHDIENLSTRELQQAIKDRDQAIKENKELLTRLDNTKNTIIKVAEERDKLREEANDLQSNVRLTDQVLKDTQADVKMLQETLEKERNEAKLEVEKLSESLKNAKNNGSSDEKVIQLEADLEEAQHQVQELTDKINEPVTIDVAVIEKVPEAVEQELAALREKTKVLEKQAAQSTDSIVKYTVYFKELTTGFKNLLGALAEIEEKDPDLHEKYKNAVTGLLGKMSENL